MDHTEVRQRWAERSGEFSPEYYAYYGPNEASELVRAALERRLDRDAAVLELGCSSGRHLAHLREAGFSDLTGIEVNGDAFDVMAEAYPDLAAAGTFHAATIESTLPDYPADRFDAVYSVETLQHIHPEMAWVFGDVARVAGDLLVTVENEGDADGSGERGAGGERGADPAADAGQDPDGQAANQGAGDPVDVSLVNDDFPLYHRNWRRVFAEHGCRQVAEERGVGPVDNDTFRAFRPA